MIRITIIEDDTTIRRNLVAFIGFHEDMELVVECGSVEDFLHLMSSKALKADILLLDIGLPGMSGLEGISKIKEKAPNIDIIMLTTYDEEEKIFAALQSGACSYLSKKTSLEKIIETIRIVHGGGSYMSPAIARKLTSYISKGAPTKNTYKLTPKQVLIIEGLVDGLSYKGLATRLDVSVSKIKTHIKRIYQTMHVSSKSEAVAKYLKSS